MIGKKLSGCLLSSRMYVDLPDKTWGWCHFILFLMQFHLVNVLLKGFDYIWYKLVCLINFRLDFHTV